MFTNIKLNNAADAYHPAIDGNPFKKIGQIKLNTFLDGTRRLPKTFTRKYKLKELLGAGGHGFVVDAISRRDKTNVIMSLLNDF